MGYELRDYQTAAAAAILRALSERKDSRPVAVLPTGAGKSLVLAEVARAAVQDWHGRVLVLAHVKELLQQNAEKLRALLPSSVAVGIHSAGLKRRDTDEPVVVAGVQSAVRRAAEFGKVNLAIVDECFPAGTEIDTPAGPCKIEDAFVGQAVFNAAGVGRVEAISVRPTRTLCKLELEDGTNIECTQNHRFFTENGWCEARALAVGARVFRREDVSDMRNQVSAESSSGRKRGTALVRSRSGLESARLLFAGMPMERPAEAEAAATSEAADVERTGKSGEEDLSLLRNGVSSAVLRDSADEPKTLGAATVLFHPVREADGESGVRERGQNARPDSAKVEGRQRPEHAGSAEADVGDSFGHGGRGASNRHDNGAARARTSACAEAGRRDSVLEAGRRTGRQVAQGGEGSRSRQAEEHRPRGTRVVRLETVELARPVPVFNIQVSGSPTYFACGVLVHNCHLIPPEGEGMYRTLFEELRKENPGLRVAGFTATPFRLGHGLIYGGDGNIFTEKCYEVGVRELIERGFLSPLVSRTHDAGARLAGLHMRGGEFVAEEAEAAMREAGVTDRIVADAAAKAAGRKAALVFAAGVEHARELADALAAASGERAEVLTGETPPDERARLLAAFRGEIATDLFGEATERPLKWLVNVGVLTTGFDAPNCDCVVLARATASTGLYVQMVGRGFRRSPETGKTDCLVLDYGDNILRHGPVDAPEAFAGGGPGAGAVAWKRCPECEAAVPTGALKCHACGHEWPPRTREIGAGLAEAASGRAIISGEETEPVDEVDVVTAEFWEVHAKRNAPPDAPRTVQITYFCGPGRRFREWLCPEHVGFARNRSEKVWAFRVQPWSQFAMLVAGELEKPPMPTSAEECVAAWDRGEIRGVHTVRLSRQAGEKYIRAEAVDLVPATPPPNPEPTADRGDAWEPPATDAPAHPAATAPANPEWDDPMDDLPF